MGINIENINDMVDCLDCKLGKARQKSIPKTDENRSKIASERLCIDISSARTKTTNKKFWVLVEDQAICMKSSYFVNHKSDQVKLIVNFIKEIC